MTTVYVATDKGVVRSTNGTDWYTLTCAKGKQLIITMLAVEGTTVYGEVGRRIYHVNNGMTMWERVIPKIPIMVLRVLLHVLMLMGIHFM